MYALVLWLAPWTATAPDVSIEDLNYLPCRATCEDALAFLDGREEWLKGQLAYHEDDGTYEAWCAVWRDAQWREECWRALLYAHSDRTVYEELGLSGSEGYTRETYRKAAICRLQELKHKLIGEEAYRLHLMPQLVDLRYCTPTYP